MSSQGETLSSSKGELLSSSFLNLVSNTLDSSLYWGGGGLMLDAPECRQSEPYVKSTAFYNAMEIKDHFPL